MANEKKKGGYDVHDMLTHTLGQFVREELSPWGVVFMLIEVQAGYYKWAKDIYDLMNEECISIDIDPVGRTWTDWKHGDRAYRQPTKASWGRFVVWMMKTFGLTYLG